MQSQVSGHIVTNEWRTEAFGLHSLTAKYPLWICLQENENRIQKKAAGWEKKIHVFL